MGKGEGWSGSFLGSRSVAPRLPQLDGPVPVAVESPKACVGVELDTFDRATISQLDMDWLVGRGGVCGATA